MASITGVGGSIVRANNSETPRRFDVLSRAQLLGGMFATGALAACSGGTNDTRVAPSASAPIAPQCGAAATNVAGDRYGINEIFAHDAFRGLDKAALLDLYDKSPKIDALHQGYFTQTRQQVQTGNVISQIPSVGIVIRSPGTFTFAGDVRWSPNDISTSAISIQCDDVTLDLGGFTLTVIAPKEQQTAGILISGPPNSSTTTATISNITIRNGTVANATECGILARSVFGLKISRVTVTGVCMQNLGIRDLTPSGIHVSTSNVVEISDCSVTLMDVTTDSSAAFQLLETNLATVSGCRATGITNHDGAVQGFSYIGCTSVTTTGCTAGTLQSHFNGNVLTTGHTVLGFCPIFCQNLTYTDCSASGLIGCCDDCHGMSVFLDAQVTVNGFRADHVVDGVSPSNSGAKATGLEVYGAGVTLIDCAVSDISAINPQDKQAAGFSAWGALLAFVRCTASNVSVRVTQPDSNGSRGTGFGWAPDPRCLFCYIPAVFVSYTDCTADHCDVAFDTWYHIDSTWIRPIQTNCTVGFLVEPGGTRTVSGNPCSECSPPVTTTLTNLASGNTYPH